MFPMVGISLIYKFLSFYCYVLQLIIAGLLGIVPKITPIMMLSSISSRSSHQLTAVTGQKEYGEFNLRRKKNTCWWKVLYVLTDQTQSYLPGEQACMLKKGLLMSTPMNCTIVDYEFFEDRSINLYGECKLFFST